MKKQNHVSAPAVGGSSLLVIFAVLCLTVFAMLSLSTVQAEKRLSNAMADAVIAYYEADMQAEEIFARLRNGETVPGILRADGVYRYSCRISNSQVLEVEVREMEDGWHVLRWQNVAYAESYSKNLPVWDGN